MISSGGRFSQNSTFNPKRPQTYEEDKSKTFWSHTFQENFVDLLGGLVPGVFFFGLGGVALIFPLWIFSEAISPPIDYSRGLFSPIKEILEIAGKIPGPLWLIMAVFCLVISYTVGHLFYRQPPKRPDQLSFSRVRRKELEKWKKVWDSIDATSNKEKIRKFKKIIKTGTSHKKYAGSFREFFVRIGSSIKNVPLHFFKLLGIQFSIELDDCIKGHFQKFLKGEYCCSSCGTCEFPYPFIKNYLEERGHGDLLKHIKWSSENMRSKTHINKIKLQLEFHAPEKCRRIVRNEAHVRLATSTWYAASTLRTLCKYTFLLGAAGFLLIVFQMLIFETNEVSWQSFTSLNTLPVFSWYLPSTLPILLISTLSYYYIRTMEGFIHYQRVREVFYVLQTAETADQDIKCSFRWPS